ncbi:MAG: response regulator transcription factor [Pseudonocardia sp.]|nr:response regulator transcription factor [Pseudonocardia sp.]
MRVVIGEDETLLREGLVLLLARSGLDVVGLAAGGPALVRPVMATGPDLVVTDIRMPPTHTDEGLRAALEIRSARPGTAVLVLSQHVQRRYAVELLGDRPAGVGYLLKQRVADVTAFCADVRRVGDGGTALDPEVVSALLAGARRRDALEHLTARQREVLGLIAEGRSNAAIARRLTISEKAVVAHTSHIYDQLDILPDEDDHRRVLAVVRYLAG